MMARRFLLVLVVCCAGLVVGGCAKEKSWQDILVYGKPPDVTFVDNIPVWRGIMVGKATREDVLSMLGTPEKTWSSGDLEVMRYLPQGYRREKDDFVTHYRLILREGIVQVIDVKTWGYKYRELVAETGQPQRVIEYSPSQDDVAIFADRGLAAVLVGSPGDYDVISHLRCYVPTSVEDYMEKWGRFHPEDLPWPSPIPSRADRLGLVPGKTSRTEVEALLGQPDFEWTDEKSKLQFTYYHIPGRDYYRLHQFAFRGDVLTWLNVEIWEAKFPIDDAIAALGEVETTIRPTAYDRTLAVQYYLWPDKGIALVALAIEPSSPIKTKVPPIGKYATPSGDDLVVTYVQFEPMSLEAFLKQELDQRITDQHVKVRQLP